MSNTIIISIGHTAAGKTTTLRMLSKVLDIDYISEGALKRSLRPNYSTADSLDEDLRDMGYKLAINNAVNYLVEGKNVILDASFHKKFRRDWVFETLEKKNVDATIIWCYVNCPNEEKVCKRIEKRKQFLNNADTQANSISIYRHIVDGFDSDFDSLLHTNHNTLLLSYDTDINDLRLISSNFPYHTNEHSVQIIDVLVNYSNELLVKEENCG